MNILWTKKVLEIYVNNEMKAEYLQVDDSLFITSDLLHL